MNPGARPSAEAVLQRLLLVLPLASQEGGANVDALADDLGVPPRRLFRDLEEVESRSYYLRAGLGDAIQLTLTHDHLTVWTTGEFRRPVRLTPREAVALELALRLVAGRNAAGNGAEGGDAGEEGGGAEEEPGTTAPERGEAEKERAGAERDRRGSRAFEELRAHVVAALRSPAPEDAEDPAVALSGVEAGSDPLRDAVEEAVRNRRELRIRYRAPGKEAELRRVGPIVLAHAEGRWYVVARDLEQEELRAFRLDRTVEAEERGAGFRPSDEDREEAEGFFRDGRVLGTAEDGEAGGFEAVVEYSARIARWVRERGWEDTEELAAGGLRVRHRVLDPEWLLRHVLSYGPDARVVEPRWMARRVMEVAARVQQHA